MCKFTAHVHTDPYTFPEGKHIVYYKPRINDMNNTPGYVVSHKQR